MASKKKSAKGETALEREWREVLAGQAVQVTGLEPDLVLGALSELLFGVYRKPVDKGEIERIYRQLKAQHTALLRRARTHFRKRHPDTKPYRGPIADNSGGCST